MKKKVLIVLGIILGIVILGLIIFFSSKLIKDKSFEGVLEKKEFTINNVIKKYKDKTIMVAYEGIEKDKKYSITYLEFNSDTSANKYFNKEKKRLNDSKDEDAATNYWLTNKIERYTVNMSNNHYIAISKKKNVIIYYDVDSKYSEEIINLVEHDLGY